MALLTDGQRRALWAAFQRGDTGPMGALTKADLRAAVDALDAFLESNSAAINSAIPQPARGALTARQKAMLLVHVVDQRYKVT